MKTLLNHPWQVCWQALFVFMGAGLMAGSYAAAGEQKLNDFDGDRKADLILYNSTNGLWSFRLSSMGYSVGQITFGGLSYTPVAGDFDGDDQADMALYCQTNGNWLVRLSGLGYATTLSATLGGIGALPVVGDYDGDNKADPAVYSQSNGMWQVRFSGSGYALATTSFGDFNYLPATGDFDGDGESDLVIYNRTNELWVFALSSDGYTPQYTSLGIAGSLPVCDDFDGDGEPDLALYSQTNGNWSLRLSCAGYALINTNLGGVDWAPVAGGDFDGDGRADLTVYNRTNGLWLFRLSSNGDVPISVFFGGAGDRPLGSPAGSSWERYAGSPVVYPDFEITPGGAWSMATGDPSVFYDEQERKWKMWFSTAWAEGTNGRVGIKYAESADGKNWIIQDGLCLGPTGNTNDWDATDADTPAVVKNPAADATRRYLLWYSGGNKMQRVIGASAYYQIGLAFSADGKTFARLASAESPYGKAGLALMVQDAFPAYPSVQDGVLTDPDVVLKDGVYHLWMSSIGLTATGEYVTAGMSYATSSNGINWIPSPTNPLPTLPRENPVALAVHPSVLWNQSQGYFEMWYQSDSDSELEQLPIKEAGMVGYWHAISLNGEEWINYYNQARDFTGDRSYPFESYNLMAFGKVVLKDGEYYMYYPAYGTNNVPFYLTSPMWAINLAIRR
ncbi:MAG: hypothetical protein HYV35_03605 [Lentisphaerae bacterium]|nr:hypothetical protein [Lentisphaerota bacterium]